MSLTTHEGQMDGTGMRIGIVCDVGVTPSSVLRHHLQRHDVLGYFDGFAFSDEVGVYKPAGPIFQVALEAIGVTADAAAHVGDLHRTDVKGADALGMTSVRYASSTSSSTGCFSSVSSI